jgi:hypothetical protein
VLKRRDQGQEMVPWERTMIAVTLDSVAHNVEVDRGGARKLFRKKVRARASSRSPALDPKDFAVLRNRNRAKSLISRDFEADTCCTRRF